MLISSISAGSADETAHATERETISSNNRSRQSAVNAFESAKPGICRSGLSTTAPAITGPARQPRPTSSTPATHTNPYRRSEFSMVRRAPTFFTTRVTFLRCLGCLMCPGCLNCLFLHFLLPRGLALQLADEVQLCATNLG